MTRPTLALVSCTENFFYAWCRWFKGVYGRPSRLWPCNKRCRVIRDPLLQTHDVYNFTWSSYGPGHRWWPSMAIDELKAEPHLATLFQTTKFKQLQAVVTIVVKLHMWSFPRKRVQLKYIIMGCSIVKCTAPCCEVEWREVLVKCADHCSEVWWIGNAVAWGAVKVL